MGLSDWVTVLGVWVTLFSMAVSIWQAARAKKSSQTAISAMAAVQLAAVGERLKLSQEHIRDVAPEKKEERGYKVGNRFDLIRREFDNALNALPKAGSGSMARSQITLAQKKLNEYQETFSMSPNVSLWRELQIFVQDAISELGANALSSGEIR